MNITNLQNIRKMSPGYETKLSRSLTSPKRNGFGHPHLSSKVVLIVGKNIGGGGDVDLDDVGGDGGGVGGNRNINRVVKMI